LIAMIESPLLIHLRGYRNGKWAGARSGETLDVLDPATGECLASIPNMGAGETHAACVAAAAGLAAMPPPAERSRWLLAIHDALRENRQELARIITLENGKPLKESEGEVDYAAAFFRHFSGQMAHLEAETLPEPIRNCRWTLHHRPAGVAALITPWNFPLAMLAKKMAAALAAGCTAVVKPSELTPLSPIALWHLLESLGVPGRILQLVTGMPDPIGEVLATHPEVRVISFTGSTEVGRLLIKKSAPTVKRLSLELGGNAPFIVFPDADLESAAGELMTNKFRTGGQTCVCTNRVYVHEDVAEPFTERVAEGTRKLRVGNGMDPGTDIGPLINLEGFDKVARHVADALHRGARRIVGSDPVRPEREGGAFYPPTVLAGVTPEMVLCREETFGPVISISTFRDEAGLIEQANNTIHGLAAYVFTGDPERGDRVVRRLHFGHVGLNTATGPTPEAPFGGMKQSGLGREGGAEGLLEFCETQVVARGQSPI